jgi:hypothetical protein
VNQVPRYFNSWELGQILSCLSQIEMYFDSRKLAVHGYFIGWKLSQVLRNIKN